MFEIKFNLKVQKEGIQIFLFQSVRVFFGVNNWGKKQNNIQIYEIFSCGKSEDILPNKIWFILNKNKVIEINIVLMD